MRDRLLIAGGVFLGVAMCAQAQQTGATVEQRTQGPEAASNMGKEANYETLQEHQRGGISFIGKVVVQDAMFPWDPIPVVVTCNGEVRYRTETDAKGAFTIQGENANSEVSPEVHNAQQSPASKLIGCDAAASLAGFQSTTVHIANLNIMDNPDIGTITLRPDSNAAGSATSATTTTASPDAMKKFNKARSEWLNRNLQGAEKDLQKAVQTDPKFADAWYQLGKLQEMDNKLPDALSSYQKAVAADPKFVPPYERIAEVGSLQKQWQAVVDATGQALKLDPAATPQIWYLNALGKLNTNDTEGAEASCRKALAMDPQHTAPNTEQLLAVILANRGEYAEALKHLQNSLTYIKSGPNADLIKQQIAQLEKVLPQSNTN